MIDLAYLTRAINCWPKTFCELADFLALRFPSLFAEVSSLSARNEAVCYTSMLTARNQGSRVGASCSSVQPRGFIVLDDHGWSVRCMGAVDGLITQRGLSVNLTQADYTARHIEGQAQRPSVFAPTSSSQKGPVW